MKILVAGLGQYPWFAPAWVRALQRLGQEAHFFDFGSFWPKGILGRLEGNRMWSGGGFLLAERSDVMQALYEEGKESEYFGSSEELIDKIRFYLRQEVARRRVASAGHQRCISSGYDILSRMRGWLSDIQGFRRR